LDGFSSFLACLKAPRWVGAGKFFFASVSGLEDFSKIPILSQLQFQGLEAGANGKHAETGASFALILAGSLRTGYFKVLRLLSTFYLLYSFLVVNLSGPRTMQLTFVGCFFGTCRVLAFYAVPSVPLRHSEQNGRSPFRRWWHCPGESAPELSSVLLSAPG
jgi:hypothetical protein